MKPGLSLRVSQHLALTPQLQQSIKLLQLSTLELDQEVEQMLDDNPFLERETDTATREEFGLDSADTPASGEEAEFSLHAAGSTTASAGADEPGSAADADPPAAQTESVDWDGDGTVDVQPDDGEWAMLPRAPIRAGPARMKWTPSILRVHMSRSPTTCTGRHSRCICRRSTVPPCAS